MSLMFRSQNCIYVHLCMWVLYVLNNIYTDTCVCIIFKYRSVLNYSAEWASPAGHVFIIFFFIMILQQKPVVEYSSFPSSVSYNSTCSGQTALYTAYRRGARLAFPCKEHAGNPSVSIQHYLFNINYTVYQKKIWNRKMHNARIAFV